MKKAPFTSLRGKFKFGNNNYPIQDFYQVKVVQVGDKFATSIDNKVFTDYQDPHAKDCSMK